VPESVFRSSAHGLVPDAGVGHRASLAGVSTGITVQEKISTILGTEFGYRNQESKHKYRFMFCGK
jgi:hypothetical protein